MKKIVFVLIVSLFVSCSSQISTAMQSWVGHHKSSLIQSWGPPSNITTDGKGGEVYIYYYNRNLPSNSKTTYNSFTGTYNTTTTNNSYTAQRMFFINSSGKIYSWKWKGY